MKLLSKIPLYTVAAFLAVSCVIYSDKDIESEPSFEYSNLVYSNDLEPVFRTTELALFFAEYQAVRNDREASVALYDSYFGGSPVSLYYEKASVYDWGEIFLTEEENVYKVSSYTYSDDYDYSVKVTGSDGKGPDRMEGAVIEMEKITPDKPAYAAGLTVDNGIVSLNSLEYDITGAGGTRTVITVVEPLEMPVCSRGGYSLYPESGCLKYVLTGTVEDEFEVKYTSEGSTIICDGKEILYAK